MKSVAMTLALLVGAVPVARAGEPEPVEKPEVAAAAAEGPVAGAEVEAEATASEADAAAGEKTGEKVKVGEGTAEAEAPVDPAIIAKARDLGEQIGQVEMATWKLVADGKGDDGTMTAVGAHYARAKVRLKALLLASPAMECAWRPSGRDVGLRPTSKPALEGFREGFRAATEGLAELKQKLARDETTRAVTAKVLAAEREFHSDLCLAVLAELGKDKPEGPILQQREEVMVDS